MARIARFTIPGVVHHVISRFVDREWFFAADIERARYLSLLGRALAKSDWRCLAYCLMSNHIHLAMLGGQLDLESWAKKVNSPFAVWLNKQRGRLGPVLAERPAVHIVPRHREAEVIAYIHNNPVRAKVVANARNSTWSSHRAYVGLERRPDWLCVNEGLERVGCDGDPDGFETFVNGVVGTTLELPDLDRVRTEVRRQGAYDVGTPTLSEPAEVPIVRRRGVQLRPHPAVLLEAVAAVVGVPASATNRRYGRGAISTAKRIFIHAGAELGIAIADASASVGISRQRGSQLANTNLSADERGLVKAVVALLRQEGA